MGRPSSFRSFWRAEQGVAAIAWALSLPLVIGAVALGIDIGSWYLAHRSLQTATDIAAIDAGYHLGTNTVTQPILASAANHSLSGNGYTIPGNMTVTVNYPPTSGSYSGNTNAVEVITSEPQARYFSRMFMASDPQIDVRAVSIRQPAGSACVLALNTTAANALEFQGNTTINLSNCSGASNSTSTSAVGLSGSSIVNAASLYAVGSVAQGGSSQLTTTYGTLTGGSSITDPYASLSVPNYVGCTKNNFNATGTNTISPGVYCNGLSFAANSNTTLSPGTYIIDRGSFKVNNNATVSGNGVTIILTSSTGSSYANVTINGGSSVSLTAPTTGTYAGMLMFQDRNAPYAASTANKLNGGATMSLVGAIYFPKQGVQFSGNSSNNSGSCTKIVADTVTFIGDSYLNNNCPNSVTKITTQGKVSLVE